MELREFKNIEWSRKLAEALEVEGLSKRAKRLRECCSLISSVDGIREGRRRCRDAFCVRCSRSLIGDMVLRIGRLGESHFVTFTWREGVHVGKLAESMMERNKYLRFALQGSSGVAKWEFTERSDGTLHLHLHCVTDVKLDQVRERFAVHHERSVDCREFDGNAVEVGKYVTPCGDIQGVAKAIRHLHGKHARTRSSWGVCRGGTDIGLLPTTMLPMQDGSWAKQRAQSPVAEQDAMRQLEEDSRVEVPWWIEK